MLDSEEENQRALITLVLTIILGSMDNFGSLKPFFTMQSIHTAVFFTSGVLIAVRYYIHFQVDTLNAEVDVSYIVFTRVLLRGSVFFFMCGVALLVVDYGGVTASPFAVLLTMTPLYLITKRNQHHERKLFLFRLRVHLKKRKTSCKDFSKFINRKRINKYFAILYIEGKLISFVFLLLIITEIVIFTSVNIPSLQEYFPRNMKELYSGLSKSTTEMTSSVWYSVMIYLSFAIAMAVAILPTSTPQERKAFFERRFSPSN